MENIKKLDMTSILMRLDDEVCRLCDIPDKERRFGNVKLSLYHSLIGELFSRSLNPNNFVYNVNITNGVEK